MKIVSKKGRSLGRPSDIEKLVSNQVKALNLCYADPIYFINNYIKIENSIRAVIPITLHDYQEEYVRAMHTEPALCSVMCRQSGSTTASLAYMLWTALFNNDKKVMIGGASLSMTQHMCHTMQLMITELPIWLRPSITHLSRTLIQFGNGSSINMGVTSDGLLRGRTIDVLYFDSFAMSSAKVQADVMAPIYQTVSMGGKVFLSSTPNGHSNMFAKVYHDSLAGRNVFIPFKKTIDDMPQFDAKWKKMMKNVIGQAVWDREFECNF